MTRYKKLLLSTLALALALMFMAAAALAAGYGVTKDRIRVRASASLKANVVDNLKQGSCVYILSTSKSGDTTFAKIQYRALGGKVSTGYAAMKQGSSTYITTLSASQAKSKFGVSGGNLPNAAAGVKESGTSVSASAGTAAQSTASDSDAKAIETAQKGLKALGLYNGNITGHAGTQTVKAIKAFQKSKGLSQTGKADAATLKAIANAQTKKASTGTASGETSGLKVGSEGTAVKTLQKNLTTLGYYYGNITGHYGEKTATAVKKFQKDNGLGQTGVAGKTTQSKIASAVKKAGTTSGSASKQLYTLNWFTAKDNGVFKKIGFAAGKTATLTDVTTGKSLKVRIQSSGQHLDVEPLTKADTKTLCAIYGVTNPKKISARRRAMILETVHGYRIACSCYGTPHGSQVVRDNSYPGQFCLHFLNSKTSATGKVDSEHQSAVRRAVATVGKSNVVKLNNPNDIR